MINVSVGAPALETDLIELEVEISGGPHGRYHTDFASGSSSLAEVVYPPERYPADLCALVDSLRDDGQAPLGALLLGNVSHPPGCRVAGRLLGVLRAQGPTSRQYPVAVAAADPHFANIASVDALSPARRASLEAFISPVGTDEMAATWLEVAHAQAVVHEARQRFRLARAKQRQLAPLEPAWKPAHSDDEAGERGEAERHTAAEYSFYRLPYRFQQYVEASLLPDERIVFSVHRPAMRSALQRGFIGRQRLEEAVLVIGDSQVALVAELMPPDSAGIRYGFVDRTGAPERLVEAQVMMLSNAVAGLALTWRAAHGHEQSIWEFPASCRADLETAAGVLRGWLPRTGDRRVQRATPPTPLDPLPPLRDPAANEAAEVQPIAARLETAMSAALCPGERVLARCLLPAWVEHGGRSRLLAVTARRLLVVAGGAKDSLAQSEIDLPLGSISSLEFSSTLVNSYLLVMTPKAGQVVAARIRFTKTLVAMEECYHMLRRALGVARVVSQSQASR